MIDNIIEMDILKNGIIIVHRKKGDLDVYPNKFEIIDRKNYGYQLLFLGKLTKFFFCFFNWTQLLAGQMDLLSLIFLIKLFLT